jgi:hypothetical protein
MVFTKFTHKGFFQADNSSSNECHGNYVKAIQKWNLAQMPNGITKFTHKKISKLIIALQMNVMSTM